MLYICMQREDVLEALGSREEPPASVSLESMLDEDDSVISMDPDFQDIQSSELQRSFHELYSSDDSELESDEDDEQDQQMLPSPDAPDSSFLSLSELESSALEQTMVPSPALEDEQMMESSPSDHQMMVSAPPLHDQQAVSALPLQGQQMVGSAPTVQHKQPPWNGFCIFGDNIDKTVRPQHQTVSRPTKSFHMFQSFAQLDRINLSGVSDEPPQPLAVDPNLLMPSLPELHSVMSRFTVLISRYIHA